MYFLSNSGTPVTFIELAGVFKQNNGMSVQVTDTYPSQQLFYSAYSISLYIEPLMTIVTRFLGIEHTCKRISLKYKKVLFIYLFLYFIGKRSRPKDDVSRLSLPAAVSLIYQAIPVVPTVLTIF